MKGIIEISKLLLQLFFHCCLIITIVIIGILIIVGANELDVTLWYLIIEIIKASVRLTIFTIVVIIPLCLVVSILSYALIYVLTITLGGGANWIKRKIDKLRGEKM